MSSSLHGSVSTTNTHHTITTTSTIIIIIIIIAIINPKNLSSTSMSISNVEILTADPISTASNVQTLSLKMVVSYAFSHTT